MPRLLYITPARMPTEKAHGLQIIQNCEAFADAGYDVELWVARRWNRGMRHVEDIYRYYGVKPNFKIIHVFCLDLMPLAFHQKFLERLAFYLQLLSFMIFMCARVLFSGADIYYTRERFVALTLSFFKPRNRLAYEIHTLSPSQPGARIQTWATRRVGSAIPISTQLAKDLIARGTPSKRVIVAHDGIRRERFAHMLSQAEARARIGWPQEYFIVGYIGRLHTMGMDKGVGVLVEAVAQVNGMSLALVGGPDKMAEALKQQWRDLGSDEKNFLYAGHVPADDVPMYLSALDICAMPFPWIPHFAYYMSPLKLFEYMASQRAIVASDLPAISDVVTHEQTALLYQPEDAFALATALRRLHDEPDLRQALSQTAYQTVIAKYTWEARTTMILKHIQQAKSYISD